MRVRRSIDEERMILHAYYTSNLLQREFCDQYEGYNISVRSLQWLVKKNKQTNIYEVNLVT